MPMPGSNGLLQPIKGLLEDVQISEIIINSPGKVFYERCGKFYSKVVDEFDINTLHMLFQLIARENNQIINEQDPLLSGNLSDGSRVQLVLPPVAIFPALSIRRYVLKSFSLNDYSNKGFFEHINLPNETLTQDIQLLNFYESKQSIFQ